MAGSLRFIRLAGALGAGLLTSTLAQAQGPFDTDGKVASFGKITTLTGGFGAVLSPGDQFGDSASAIGDLDGNGVPDVAIGVPGEDDGGSNRGGVWILFLNASGAVIDQQKISDTEGGFGGTLANNDAFGTAVDCAGDLDGDGRNELAVGTDGEKLFVLFLNGDGTVSSEQEISAGMGGFGGALSAGDLFGAAVGSAGDLDGDGIPELAVGARGDDDGGANRGAVWILFLNDDGTVASEQKISSTAGGFGAGLSNADGFGTAVEGIDDLDQDGIPELVVGAPLTNGTDFIVSFPGAPPTPVAAADEGVVFVLFLNDDGTVASKVEIGQSLGGFGAQIFAGEGFGSELSAMGDIGGHGQGGIAVGVPNYGLLVTGGFYEVFLESDGTVARERLITDKKSGFKGGPLQSLLLPFDRFSSPAYMGDIDGDCVGDFFCGAGGDDAPGVDAGAAWFLLCEGELQATSTFRNGSGVNPVAYASTSQPRLGRNWTSEVDVTVYAGTPSISFIIGQDGPDMLASNFGEILVSLVGVNLLVDFVTPVGGVASFSIPVPNDLSLLGFDVFTQGGIGGTVGPKLVNAVDIKVAY